ncbi:MAG TPA: hypothetical protein VGH10_11260 [Actinomycetota bacterium]|jgi:hypothetical protein
MPYEIPDDLSARERRIVQAAIDELARASSGDPHAWAQAGRREDGRGRGRPRAGSPGGWRGAVARPWSRGDATPRDASSRDPR